ncbi:hypothetical protein [Marinifilum sp.]|uniref:hypothetical protein n=1 Tax=Marinifilum sp. TaxID=2033137 RepID=UPI003BACC9AC
MVNGEDEEKINNYLQKRNNRPVLQNVIPKTDKLKSSNEEDINEELETLVADDEFASLLNENGEIQVGDSLYKYTESGLYFVHINDEEHLKEYLAKNKQGNSVHVINTPENFFGFRYTNAWFVTNNLSVGFGIGLELAPVTEWPVVLDVRKYFGDKANRNYLVFNAGKAMDGYNGMETLLGELGYGRNIKLGKKTSLNLSLNYQLTYLKDGEVKKTREIHNRNRVRDFYTHSLGVKLGLMF